LLSLGCFPWNIDIRSQLIFSACQRWKLPRTVQYQAVFFSLHVPHSNIPTDFSGKFWWLLMSYKMYIPWLFYYVTRTLNTNSMPNAYIQRKFYNTILSWVPYLFSSWHWHISNDHVTIFYQLISGLYSILQYYNILMLQYYFRTINLSWLINKCLFKKC